MSSDLPAPSLSLTVLRKGNARFSNSVIDADALPHRLLSGRRPACIADIVVVGDFPVPVEMLFDCGLGELKVFRVGAADLHHGCLDALQRRVTQGATSLVIVLTASAVSSAETIAKDASQLLNTLQASFANVAPANVAPASVAPANFAPEDLLICAAQWHPATGVVEFSHDG